MQRVPPGKTAVQKALGAQPACKLNVLQESMVSWSVLLAKQLVVQIVHQATTASQVQKTLS